MYRLIFSVSLLLFGFSTFAQLTPEGLWELDRVSLDDVSADGKYAVYGIKTYDLAKNSGNRDLYLLDIKSGKSTRLTSTGSDSEYNARFRPDGKRIGFLIGDSMYEIALDGSDKKAKNLKYTTGFAYAPTQDYVMFTGDRMFEQSITNKYKSDLPQANAHLYDKLMYRHWSEWHDYKYSNLYANKYVNGDIIKDVEAAVVAYGPYDVPLKPFGGMEQMTWSPDGKYIAFTWKKLQGLEYATSTNSDIYLYEMASEKLTNLSEENKGYDMEPAFSPDSRYIAWNSMETPGFEADRNRIVVYDMEKQKLTEITAGADRSYNHPQWSRDGSTIFCSGGVEATYQLFAIDVRKKKVRQITEGIHNYDQFALAGDNMLLARRASMSMPHELYTVNTDNGQATQVTFANKKQLDKINMGKVTQKWINTTDGKRMLTWVIYPPGYDSNKKYPALLYCQGGPQSAVSQFWSYRWNFQLMAANGYIIYAPNRRGLPSFGREWNDQISGDWGGQPMEDLLAAADEMAKDPNIKSDKIGAVGASYGGYSVYWLAGNHKNRFSAFISHCGLFNLESWYGTTEELFFANHDIGGPYWSKDKPVSYEKFSPHKYVQNWDTPILVIHGGKDYRVPLSEGMQAFNAAQMMGVPSKFLYFPEENHWVLSPQNGVLWHRVFYEWLDTYLKQ